MKLRKVVVVYKKSAYQVYGKERHDRAFLDLLGRRHPVVNGFLANHQQHHDALQKTKLIIKQLGLDVQCVYRAKVDADFSADLIISVGGDGTFLEASHRTRGTPMLGVNSNPTESVGMLCGIDVSQLPAMLQAIDSGKVKPSLLSRLQVSLDGHVLPYLILNDCLVAHPNPAAMSRFAVKYKQKFHEVVGSGIWVAPAAGTTGAMRSASGRVLPLLSKKYQFVVREPYRAPGVRQVLRQGFILEDDRFEVLCKTRLMGLYVDGSHKKITVPWGATVVFKRSPFSLAVYGFNRPRRRLMEDL